MNRHTSNAPQRAVVWTVAGLLLLIVLSMSAGEVAAPVLQEKNQRMLKQKMALVERILFQSPLGKQATQQPSELSPDVFAVWEFARQELEKAQECPQDKRCEGAHEHLDSALSFYRQAAALNRSTREEHEDFAGMLPVLRSRIEGYQDSLDRIAQEKKIALPERLHDQQIKATLSSAELLEKSGDAESAALLLQALQSMMEHELIQIRSGETIVTSLEFDSSENALEYEMRTNAGNEKLLLLLLEKSSIDDHKQRLVTDYLQQSRDECASAMQYRSAGDFELALRSLEVSTDIQLKALRLFGIRI